MQQRLRAKQRSRTVVLSGAGLMALLAGTIGCSAAPGPSPKAAGEPGLADAAGAGDGQDGLSGAEPAAASMGDAAAKEAGGAAGSGDKAKVSVMAISEGCPNDGIIAEAGGYSAAFRDVLGEVARCHASGNAENSVSVKLDASGIVKAFEVVKGNGACLKETVKKVRFPSYTCGAMLVIVSSPGAAP